MFMQSIINNQITQSSRSRRVRSARRTFNFNNGYNTLQSSPPPNNSNTIVDPPPVSGPEPSVNIPNTAANVIQYQLFNINLNVYVNNLTSELENVFNSNRYYSTFEYESFNIRFFHSELIDLQNINEHVDNVLNNINELEVHNILNNFQDNEPSGSENTSEIINKIGEHTVHDKYINYASTLKNHTCPILLTDFKDNETVSIFMLCNHAIDESVYNRYVKTFTKCPLCNHKLFEL